MSKSSSVLLWFTLFMSLFLFSQGYWLWVDELVLGPLNFPFWIFVFLGLQIVLALLLIAFSLTQWEDVTQSDDHTRG